MRRTQLLLAAGLLAILAIAWNGCTCSREPEMEEVTNGSNAPDEEERLKELDPSADDSSTPSDGDGNVQTEGEQPSSEETGDANSSDGRGSKAEEPEKSDQAATAARSAARKADKLLKKGQKLADSGDMGKAFEAARDAWASVSKYRGDAKCGQLTTLSLARMKQYGEAANRQSTGSPARGKPIIVK